MYSSDCFCTLLILLQVYSSDPTGLCTGASSEASCSFQKCSMQFQVLRPGHVTRGDKCHPVFPLRLQATATCTNVELCLHVRVHSKNFFFLNVYKKNTSFSFGNWEILIWQTCKIVDSGCWQLLGYSNTEIRYWPVLLVVERWNTLQQHLPDSGLFGGGQSHVTETYDRKGNSWSFFVDFQGCILSVLKHKRSWNDSLHHVVVPEHVHSPVKKQTPPPSPGKQQKQPQQTTQALKKREKKEEKKSLQNFISSSFRFQKYHLHRKPCTDKHADSPLNLNIKKKSNYWGVPNCSLPELWFLRGGFKISAPIRAHLFVLHVCSFIVQVITGSWYGFVQVVC